MISAISAEKKNHRRQNAARRPAPTMKRIA
jgi:hypothetical protein